MVMKTEVLGEEDGKIQPSPGLCPPPAHRQGLGYCSRGGGGGSGGVSYGDENRGVEDGKIRVNVGTVALLIFFSFNRRRRRRWW